MGNDRDATPAFYLSTASLIITDSVIPAEAGFQKKPGFRVKPGITNGIRLMSLWIIP
jgi:hypothetical protein